MQKVLELPGNPVEFSLKKSPSFSSLIRAEEVLGDRWTSQALDLDIRHGHGSLLSLLAAVGVVGPYKTLSPWEYRDPTGHRTINAAGYSALPFGDNYPPLIDFVSRFLKSHSGIGLPQQSTTPWRAALEANLIRLLSSFAPSHADSRVFFSNSGTESIEGALKFAQSARPKARHIINFTRAYHGKTLLSLSVTPNPTIRKGFEHLLTKSVTLPYGDLSRFEDAVKKLGAEHIVCVILEPIQGEAGCILPPAGFLREIGRICQEKGIIVIADEIQTGLGRTGHWFESLAQGLEPDIICLAKPLGGGLIPVGATLVRDWIFKKMLGKIGDVKRHSNTFGGNSLAMAIGLKALEILIDEDLPNRSNIMGVIGLERLRKLQAQHPKLIREVRGAGMLMAIGFEPIMGSKILASNIHLINEVTGLFALKTFYEGGVQLNFSLNSASTLRLTPAMNMPDALFDEMFRSLFSTAGQLTSSTEMFSKTPLSVLLKLLRTMVKTG
ncbi:MAG: aminotransferase class III-fold pyridoxal phosphate-dependent enzyme [Deinococcaceae bacterium]